jgi:hypothetical protein
VPVADDGAGELEQAEVKIGAAFVAGAEPFEGVQPGEGAFGDPPVAAQSRTMGNAAAGDAGADAAGAEQAPVFVMVIAAIASISGISWVMSWRCPPVRATASGMPRASVIRWCLEPGRPRSTGEGPVWSPL